jgi:hypothetical protein
MAAIGGPQKRTGMGPVHSPAAVTIHCRKTANSQTTPKATNKQKTNTTNQTKSTQNHKKHIAIPSSE